VDRVWTLLRLANVREGIDRNSAEVPPQRWFETPGFNNYLTEKPLNREELDRMIEDYYEEWGWDRKTGIPTERALKDLSLTD